VHLQGEESELNRPGSVRAFLFSSLRRILPADESAPCKADHDRQKGSPACSYVPGLRRLSGYGLDAGMAGVCVLRVRTDYVLEDPDDASCWQVQAERSGAILKRIFVNKAPRYGSRARRPHAWVDLEEWGEE